MIKKLLIIGAICQTVLLVAYFFAPHAVSLVVILLPTIMVAVALVPLMFAWWLIVRGKL